MVVESGRGRASGSLRGGGGLPWPAFSLPARLPSHGKWNLPWAARRLLRCRSKCLPFKPITGANSFGKWNLLGPRRLPRYCRKCLPFKPMTGATSFLIGNMTCSRGLRESPPRLAKLAAVGATYPVPQSVTTGGYVHTTANVARHTLCRQYQVCGFSIRLCYIDQVVWIQSGPRPQSPNFRQRPACTSLYAETAHQNGP